MATIKFEYLGNHPYWVIYLGGTACMRFEFRTAAELYCLLDLCLEYEVIV